LVNALLILSTAIAALAIDLGQSGDAIAVNQTAGIICGGGGLLLGLFLILLVLKLEDDFFFDQKRLLLRLDRDATNGPALLISGRRYAKRGMWAMAAIHLRRATGALPHQIDPYLALAVAHLKLRRYDLAASDLEAARRISPNDPQVERLTAVFNNRRATESPPDRL
jgi:tetratricopeptide (TPR) repeat protein